MLKVDRPQINPYFNIAAEEYLLKNLNEDCFMLWQNEPSVIVGKHQNALSEINLSCLHHHNIPLVRRISGGGTVYHDLGNLNFTFIKHGLSGKLVDFSQFIKPVTDALKHFGIQARQEGKNDIRVNGLKLSGNAEHVYRNKVLHHGTLLFESNLEMLNDILRVEPGLFSDKSVRSVRSRVSNIVEFLPGRISITEFKNEILNYLSSHFGDVDSYFLKTEDINGINDLVEKKYGTWEWNYGYSPDYLFKKEINYQSDVYSIELAVNKGLIRHCKITNSKDDLSINESISKIIVGIRHDMQALKQQIFLLNKKGESFTFDPNILTEWLF